MDKVAKQLRTSLLENPAVEIKESAVWHVPVVIVDATFKRVKRSKMDILMKMMLLAFVEADIRRAANLSEMLLVEELFIADLIEKMQQTGLIYLEKGIYTLTMKGKQQLETGIVEEEMKKESAELFYSPDHDDFWPDLFKSVPSSEEELTLYRYASEQDLLNGDRIFQVLSERENKLDEDGLQLVVAEVSSFEQKTIEHIPCLEFRMYNKEQDTFYARVWNTGLKRWDDLLEKQIEEKEQLQWREKWLQAEDEGQ